jgi:SAM-dependent methyltransferase
MHDTAMMIGAQFFRTYFSNSKGPVRILDVGALDVNGSLRSVAPVNAVYVGMDLAAGKGVDLVAEDPYVYPFPDEHFDAVVSSSCFEHDPMFWVTFLEILRVTKQHGLIYINVPSNGEFHRYPWDNWRFYPDASFALRMWAKRSGRDVEILESFWARRRSDMYNDFVAIFERGSGGPRYGREKPKVADAFPDSLNVRKSSSDQDLTSYSRETEDMIIIREMQAKAGRGS